MFGLVLPRSYRIDPRTGNVPRDPRRTPSSRWYPGQEYTWEHAVFTVPIETSEERMHMAAAGYRNKYGRSLEAEGWEVLGLDGPHVDTDIWAVGTCPPDRRPYVIYAKVRRRPETVTVDVPDEDVPLYEAAGYKLS